MGFFGKADDKDKSKSPDRPSEPARVEPKRGPIRTFTLGLLLGEKLATVGKERLEEGLRAVLPKGSKVAALDLDGASETSMRRAITVRPDGSGEIVRFFEVTLEKDVQEGVALLREKGLLEGQIELALDRCVVLLKATGRIAGLTGAVEAIERFSFKYDIRCESQEVLVQYPPVEVHARWLADEDYRAAYGRWRTQRSEELAKPRPWHSGWPASSGDEIGPPWVRLRPKEGRPDEHSLELDEKVLLRFAFQGAEIKIMRFNLKLLSNKLTNEYSVYRSLPLTLESLPKDVQDRMNREPERFRVLREPGKFGQSFDLVRQAYEELGGDYFGVEGPPLAPGARTNDSGESLVEPESADEVSPVPPDRRPTPAPPPARTQLPVVAPPKSQSTPTPSAMPRPTTATLRGGLRANAAGSSPPKGKPDNT